MSMTSATAARLSRIVLVGERGRLGPGPDAPVIRRYRLARLHVNGRPPGSGRHDHLRRTYD